MLLLLYFQLQYLYLCADEIVGNQGMTIKCWCVTPVIKDIIPSALCRWWLQYQRMVGSARWASDRLRC